MIWLFFKLFFGAGFESPRTLASSFLGGLLLRVFLVGMIPVCFSKMEDLRPFCGHHDTGKSCFLSQTKTILMFFRSHLWCFLVKNSWLFPSQVLCRRSDILWSLEGPGSGEASVRRSALARAPRPVLHLLRSGELAKVDAEQREDARRMRSEVPRGFSDFWGSGRCVCSRLTFANTSHYTLHSALDTSHFYTPHLTLHSTITLQCTLPTQQSTVHCLRSALHPPQSAPVPHSTLHGPQSTMYCNRGRIHKTVVITCFAKVSYATCIRIRGLDQAIFSS